MFGRLVAGLIVVGLAIGVWALWPDPESGTTTTTFAEASPTTSTTATSTTTTEPGTTTTDDAGHVVETVAEAEAILRNFWLGWFEGIYQQDEDRIKEVVASQSQLDAAINAFESMAFQSEPSSDGIRLDELEILRSDQECLVIWAALDVSAFRGDGAATDGAHVMRWTGETWKSVSTWVYRDDLWEQDCDAQLESLS